MYNLCLSSKIFFREVVGIGAAASSGGTNEFRGGFDAAAVISPTIKHLMSYGFSMAFLSDRTEDQMNALLHKFPLKSEGRSVYYKQGEDSCQKLGRSSSVLATRLLRSSLIVSLGRVLKHSKSGITLEAALSMGDLPDGYAVIAGSTIVQTCLGVLWEGRYSCSPVDVDVFCSVKGAPHVRSVRLSIVHISRY